VVKKREQHEDDETAFARAMAAADVVPLGRGGGERAEPTPDVRLPPIDRGPLRPDEHGDSDTDANVDFAADGVDRREIRKLKRGEYAVGSRCDLHGLTADAAAAAVKQFLVTSRHQHHRCICIVHGRGLRSPGGVAVLKLRVREFLRSHPAVLAYADAPPSDGGAGAVYVLLRRS
jgi:DNA-nicking Smr family endonuclease